MEDTGGVVINVASSTNIYMDIHTYMDFAYYNWIIPTEFNRQS